MICICLMQLMHLTAKKLGFTQLDIYFKSVLITSIFPHKAQELTPANAFPTQTPSSPASALRSLPSGPAQGFTPADLAAPPPWCAGRRELCAGFKHCPWQSQHRCMGRTWIMTGQEYLKAGHGGSLPSEANPHHTQLH